MLQITKCDPILPLDSCMARGERSYFVCEKYVENNSLILVLSFCFKALHLKSISSPFEGGFEAK